MIFVRYTPKENEKIIKLRKNQMTFEEIAKELKRTKGSVYKHYQMLKNKMKIK